MTKQAPLHQSVRWLIFGTVVLVIATAVFAYVMLKPSTAQAQGIAPPITITVQCMIGYKACANFTARLRGFANNYPDDIQVATAIAETTTYIPVVTIAIHGQDKPFWKSDSKNTQWNITDDGRGTLLRTTIRKACRALLSLPSKPRSSSAPLAPRPAFTSTGGIFFISTQK